MSLKRRRLILGVAPSVLLAKLADSDNTSSSDDDDEGRVYEAKFAELFDAHCTVPKVKAYVSIVRTYSDKANSNQLKKCWGNLKQKCKNERSDEKRKTHKTGGGPPPTPMSAISVLVGAVAGHMATRLVNDNDSDGAYLPPVQNEPVVRLLEGMVGCNPEYDHALTGAGSCNGRSGTNEPAQKVTEMCNFVMQRMALTPGQQETPPQEPRAHLTVPVFIGYDDVKTVADFLGELQTYHFASGASKAFIVDRIVSLAL
ncbi:hypothetical protein HPB47_027468 [Ixodes persulcatus]|uniref:Uncharacterized protein n=1 Tax=Ixodes persulcatus TaxID=34615 RepID=A0AC60PVT7_IXOPE|nr:hypothetical protein HPB47_027468 [Ixodes persulcatus]